MHILMDDSMKYALAQGYIKAHAEGYAEYMAESFAIGYAKGYAIGFVEGRRASMLQIVPRLREYLGVSNQEVKDFLEISDEDWAAIEPKL